MQSFLRRFAPVVMGALSCLDKVRFRGAVRWLAKPAGMMHFLWKVQVLLKDFPVFAKDTTATLRTAMEQAAIEQGRPVEYLASKIDKEKRAQEIAQRDGVKEGLVAVFTCVEPCMTYRVYGVRETKKLALKLELSKCLHYYHYYLDPKIGWMHTRQQTWFPFTNMTCLNGHEWLARQMDAAGLGYERRDNCFAWLEDVDQAQALAHQQLRTDWSALLEKLARRSETVVTPFVAQAGGIHLSGQPFVAIQTGHVREREPRLLPRVHPADFRVQIIMVIMQTLAQFQFQGQLFRLPHPINPIRHAGLDASEHGDEALLDAITLGDFLRAFLLVDLARQIFDRPTLLDRRLFHGGSQGCRRVLGENRKILEQDLHLPKKVHHARRLGQPTNRAAKSHLVQTTQSSHDDGRKTA